jgi:hypothetical protein
MTRTAGLVLLHRTGSKVVAIPSIQTIVLRRALEWRHVVQRPSFLFLASF